jgi:hypothetical protein
MYISRFKTGNVTGGVVFVLSLRARNERGNRKEKGGEHCRVRLPRYARNDRTTRLLHYVRNDRCVKCLFALGGAADTGLRA